MWVAPHTLANELPGRGRLPSYADPMEPNTPLERLQEALTELTAANDPQSRLASARRIRQLAEEVELDQVRAAREQGTSWSKIGGVYGLTKQGAQQRFRTATKRAKKDAAASS